MKKETLIFIPARGGSAGIKNKNLHKVKKKPLIKYTLDFSKKYRRLDKFISTDSQKIIKYCIKQGLRTEYIRPKKYASSTSSMRETLLDAIIWLEKRNITYNNVLILQPTNPLRNKKDLDRIFKIFKNKRLSSLASITQMREHPYECVVNKNKKWKFLQKSKKKLIRRQDYNNDYFFIDGTYYMLSVNFLKKNKSFVSLKNTYFYKLKNKWPIDIDYLDDVKVAESFL